MTRKVYENKDGWAHLKFLILGWNGDGECACLANSFSQNDTAAAETYYIDGVVLCRRLGGNSKDSSPEWKETG